MRDIVGFLFTPFNDNLLLHLVATPSASTDVLVFSQRRCFQSCIEFTGDLGSPRTYSVIV